MSVSPLDLQALFRDHGAMVYRRALRLLGNPADAEEATQEVFIRVLQKRESFEGRSSVTTWLYEIATNYCLNQIRDKKRRGELLEAREQPSDRRDSDSEEMVLFRQIMALASEEEARAAVYVYVDGMSQDEASELLSVSRRTVGNLLDRFKERAQAYAERLPESSGHGSKKLGVPNGA